MRTIISDAYKGDVIIYANQIMKISLAICQGGFPSSITWITAPTRKSAYKQHGGNHDMHYYLSRQPVPAQELRIDRHDDRAE